MGITKREVALLAAGGSLALTPWSSGVRKRIYYNVNSGDYTQLFVAECGYAYNTRHR